MGEGVHVWVRVCMCVGDTCVRVCGCRGHVVCVCE